MEKRSVSIAWLKQFIYIFAYALPLLITWMMKGRVRTLQIRKLYSYISCYFC